MANILIVLLDIIVITLTVITLKQARRRQKLPLPPGPPADPIIGHLRKITGENTHDLFYEWAKIYGDVMYLEILGQPMVVLNTVEAATDLLVKRGANNSDRPVFVLYEMMGWDRTAVFTGYLNQRYLKYKKMFHAHLELGKTVSYHHIQSQECCLLLQNLLADPMGHEKSLRRFATAILARVAYGHHVTSDEDPYIQYIEGSSEAMTKVPPGGTLVDSFPFLRHFPSWFPGTYYAGVARKGSHYINGLHDYPFNLVQEQMRSGKEVEPSFLTKLLESISEEEAKDPETLLDIKGAAAQIYCAGAETTWGTLLFFFLAMVLHPECQKRAQEEIDRVVGLERLPEFSDRSSLPYIEGIIQENYRWNNSLPLGVPHRSLEDDVYRGMFIPKGSILVANTRAMALDEKIYKDPHVFNPSRYLPSPQGNNEPHLQGPFGFGRRACPGRQLADASIFIAISSILAMFNILKPIGEDGEEIEPEVEFQTGLVSTPKPFGCRIVPRSERARNLVLQSETSDSF